MAQGQSPERARLGAQAAQVGGRVIVTLRSQQPGGALRAPGAPAVSPAELRDLDNELRGRGMIRSTRRLELVGAVVGTVDEEQLDSLLASPLVEMVEADVLIPMQDNGPTVPLSLRAQSTPWGVTRVQAPEAWGIVGKGAGVKVGIIDSGGDIDHPDLQWAGGFNAMTGSTSPSAWDDNVSQCNGHGTHVAGTVAARDNTEGVVGVAPEVQIYALKVFEIIDGSCLAWASSQIAALNWAVTQRIRVVNVSIGGGSSLGSYMSAINNAAAQGTFLVAAAGNTGGSVLYPGAYDNAIAIAALTSSNTRASYSSHGSEMDFAAPGSGISSTMPGGGYGSKSGTSMAAPHATGVAALLLAQNPSLTLDGLKAKMQVGALDVGTAGWEEYTGWGLLQTATSLNDGTPPPPPDPLTLVVNPGSRTHSVAQGGSGGGSNAAVQLTGFGSGTASWLATKRKTWTTLTGNSGMGSGTVSWTRNASGLAPGVYVDTITVTATGATGSPGTVIDTLVITGSSPLTLAVSPGSRNVSAQQGTAAAGSNATVTLSGTGATTTAWSATKRKAWTTLTTANGVGNGTVAWGRNTTGLAVGTYVDTITVTASGATGSPSRVIDTLVITAPPVPLTLAVSPASRSVSAQIGTAVAGSNATVTLSGTGATTTAWTATKRKAWTTLTAASGTGSGTVAWSRNTTGLAVGTYVDTIMVTATGATGSPSRVIDTLVITAAPVPLTLAVSPASRHVSAQVGTAVAGSNATVTLTGDGAAAAPWTATKRKAWTTLTTANGVGNGTVAWSRSTAGLAVGTYVDTITVTAIGATGSPTRVIDTLVITAAPVPLALAVSPASRSVSAQIGTAVAGSNATVTLTGDGAAATAWTATKRKAWTTLTTANGVGNGTVAWSRSTTGLAVGTYVDTITVTAIGATGSPTRVIDTLVITAAPVPLALAVSPGSRHVSAQIGTAVAGSNATVTLTGDGAAAAAWTATKRKAWTTLTTANGVGNGTVAWSRSTAGLAVGTYVDTITVTASGATGSPTRVIDTLVITAAPVPLALAVSPGSRYLSVQSGSAAAGSNATVTLSGDGASTTAWTATKRKAWTTLTAANGVGNGTVSWSRNATGLAVGTYVDTITVTASGATGSPARVIDTLVVTAPPVPLVLAVSPGSRHVSVQSGSPAAGSDAAVTITGDGAATTAWTATKRKAWTTLTAGNGIGNGVVSWARNTSGLAVGTHVDTITVTVLGASGSPARVIDTLVITAPPVPLAIAVSPGSRSITAQQGTAVAGSNATVTLSGTGAASTAWTATKRKAWTTLTAANGVGNGIVAWSRSTAGLTPGIYVDTISVAASGATGSPARVIDTLVVTSTPVPLTLAVSPASRRAATDQGSGTVLDESAEITISGDGATTAIWTATSRRSWNALTASSGTGSGTVRWQRNPSGLAVGLHVDTISVVLAGATGSPATVVDTFEIRAVAPTVVITMDPGSRRTQKNRGNYTVQDSVYVDISGAGANNTSWVVNKQNSYTQLSTTGGVGPRWLFWSRRLNGLSAGTYVDTLTVTGGATSARLVDTLVLVLPEEVVLGKGGGKTNVRRMSTGSATTSVELDSVAVQSASDGEQDNVAWVANSTAGWLAVNNTNGNGPGQLRFLRQHGGLGNGRHVDTIVVSLASEPNVRAFYVDTVDVITVPTPDATLAAQELFRGGGALSADQRSALDEGGNANGRYDLGDFLAWVRRSNIRLSPSVMQEVQEAMSRESAEFTKKR